ncbi:inter-alpha-trypsin inhibitor heavy chain H4-like [Mercenaria mercenaria]|uniref:inter-alpha-trypsin inhibitor heavy chain H4-like n=1 Tax=Mercenaria mercenaria TaxID=6596 RepID=UPI00234F8E31|nr:inter-alpha-trypsin inhibitor heavy chain H4-like [Mercenaria mercenaria]
MMQMKAFIFVTCLLINMAYTIKNLRHRRNSNEINVQELEIISDVALRYAKVLVRSMMINRKSADQEVAFQVRLPKEAFITSFEIDTDNRTIKAAIKEKKEAQAEYEKAKKDNVTAGLISQQDIRDDIDIDIFNVEVNVAANTTIEFRLEYEEFLQRHAGKYSQKIFIDSDHVIPNLEVKCNFKEKQKFKTLTYKTPYVIQQELSNEGTATNDGYYVNAIDWKPSESDQVAATEGLKAPFEIEYELQIEENGGIVFLNSDGEFVHMFSVPCNESEIMSKQIVFVIDISGSMSGNPILQVRQAMASILSQLRSNDYFNIIIFDDVSAMWQTSFQVASSENVNRAQRYVLQNVKARGSTNINDALLRAVGLFDINAANERSGQIIVFLTDGSPTAGVTNTSAILKNVRSANNGLEGRCCKSTIYTIAFGRHADITFLSSIAYQNAGTLTKIKEIQSDVADGQLIAMYEDIKNPYYKNLNFSFEVGGETIPATNVTQTQVLLYDCRGEIVINGRTIAGEEIYPKVKVVGVTGDIVFKSVPTILILNEDSAMLSRLVIYQWVKQLLKESTSAVDAGRRDVATNMALELSLKYGFVTPLTSLVVTDYPTHSNPGSEDGIFIHSMTTGCHQTTFNRLFLLIGLLVSKLLCHV